MPRQVRFMSDFKDNKVGDHVMVDDQVAVDAIASGAAVPSIDPIEPDPAPVAPEDEASPVEADPVTSEATAAPAPVEAQ